MMFIRQGATIKVVIGPAVAVGDGFTPVTTLSLASADEAEVILHDNGTVVDISGYTFAAITTADGYYHLTLQTGISNTVGHVTVVINDDSLILPIRADFMVVEEAVYDQLFASSAPGAATVSALATAQADLDTITGSDGVTLATTQGNYAPSKAGDLMGLANDAITAAKFDESTAFPLTQADSSSTAVARVGADGDTLETLSDQLDGTATAANLATVAGYIDTEVAAIKAKTDQLTFGTANRVDAQVYGVQNDAIGRAAFDSETGLRSIYVGAVTSSTSTTLVIDAGASSTDDIYNGNWVYIDTGTGAGQCRLIVDYDGSTRTISITGKSWAVNPDGTSTYVIIPAAAVMGTREVFTDGIYPGSISADAITASTLAADAVTEIQSGLATASALSTVAGYIDTEVAAILADTNELQTDLADGGRLDVLVDAIKAKTDNLPTDPADASDIASSFSTVNSTLSTIGGYLDTEIAAIKAVTDGLNTLLSTTGIALTAAERNAVADALLDRANGIETSVTPRQALRAIASLLCGIISGGGTGTEVFKAIAAASGGTTRVTVTVDEDGNRSAVTLNL